MAGPSAAVAAGEFADAVGGGEVAGPGEGCTLHATTRERSDATIIDRINHCLSRMINRSPDNSELLAEA